MPASIRRVRKSMNVKPTPQNKGLGLTLRIDAYDNGIVNVDGIPMNDGKDQTDAWLGANSVIATTILEFRTQVEKRRRLKRKAL